MSTTATTFDLAALAQAIERRDAAGPVAFSAPDAEARLVDKTAPPANPRVLRGRDETAAWIEDVCGREMTPRVEQPVVGDDRAAFAETCRYPDGTNVMCMTVLELASGRI